MGGAGTAAGADGADIVPRPARGKAVQLKVRSDQQRGRCLYPRAAPKVGSQTDPECAWRRLSRAQGLTDGKSGTAGRADVLVARATALAPADRGRAGGARTECHRIL